MPIPEHSPPVSSVMSVIRSAGYFVDSVLVRHDRSMAACWCDVTDGDEKTWWATLIWAPLSCLAPRLRLCKRRVLWFSILQGAAGWITWWIGRKDDACRLGRLCFLRRGHVHPLRFPVKTSGLEKTGIIPMVMDLHPILPEHLFPSSVSPAAYKNWHTYALYASHHRQNIRSRISERGIQLICQPFRFPRVNLPTRPFIAHKDTDLGRVYLERRFVGGSTLQGVKGLVSISVWSTSVATYRSACPTFLRIC